MELFYQASQNNENRPLAYLLRPKHLEHMVGQKHLLDPRGFLVHFLKRKIPTNLILWGPPGSGKTTLANIIANDMQCNFFPMNATSTTVAKLREIFERAKEQKALYQKNTILFLDEIHRFNKAQQDVFLPHMEDGTIYIIGATTENPSFELNNALLSRSKVLKLFELSEEDLVILLKRALEEGNRKFKSELNFNDKQLKYIAEYSNGDCRVAINTIEMLFQSVTDNEDLDVKQLVKLISENVPIYHDKKGDNHYETISALIKCMRASDVDASVYYLARLLDANENINFILRRAAIFASEDIGNADPQAAILAASCITSCNQVGLPEARIILSQLICYLAQAPKRNKEYMAINRAQETVKRTGNLQIPLHVRNAPTKLMKDMGFGEGYLYPHSQGKANTHNLPDKLKGKKFYL